MGCRYTFQPDGFVLKTLTIFNVILGVLAASIMPNHAAFMHRDPAVWILVYSLDFLHGIFMYATYRHTYTVSQKKQDTKLLPITSPNVNRFSKFFHW